MKKSLLAIALTTAAISLAFSGQANADGWHLNGIRLNGIKVQGIRLNGTNMQATKRQGMELQNLKVEGGQLVAVTQVAADMQGSMFINPCHLYPYICDKKK